MYRWTYGNVALGRAGLSWTFLRLWILTSSLLLGAPLPLPAPAFPLRASLSACVPGFASLCSVQRSAFARSRSQPFPRSAQLRQLPSQLKYLASLEDTGRREGIHPLLVTALELTQSSLCLRSRSRSCSLVPNCPPTRRGSCSARAAPPTGLAVKSCSPGPPGAHPSVSRPLRPACLSPHAPRSQRSQ